MNVIKILKNNMYRVLERRGLLFMALVLIPLMIGCSVFFSYNMKKSLNIALIGENIQQEMDNNVLKVVNLNKKPAISDLLLNKYDAIVEQKTDGTYEVTMIKSNKYKNLIYDYYNNGKKIDFTAVNINRRGVGANILCFVSMFVLMQGVALMTLYSDDKTNKTFRRVLVTTANEWQYLLAQGIFTFAFLFIPTFLAVFITKEIFNLQMGYTDGILTGLLAIIVGLGTAFALFVVSVVKKQDNGVMVAAVIIIITSILSGCFFTFTSSNKIMNILCGILPQKAYFSLVEGIERGESFADYTSQLSYLFTCTILFWITGCIVTKRKMKKGIF